MRNLRKGERVSASFFALGDGREADGRGHAVALTPSSSLASVRLFAHTVPKKRRTRRKNSAVLQKSRHQSHALLAPQCASLCVIEIR